MIGVTNIPNVAKIIVTAPAGSRVAAKLNGVELASELTGTGTTCTLKVRKTGNYQIVATYPYNTSYATDLSQNLTVNRLGKKYTGMTFASSFTATIRINTHPSATVTLKYNNTQMSSGNANSSGVYTYTVSTGYHGDWSATANNGATSETKTVTVAHYDDTFSKDILNTVPIINVTYNGTTYTYKGAETVVGGVFRINPYGTPTGSTWKMWIYQNLSVTFVRGPSRVNVCAVGKGGSGASFSHPDTITDIAGGGGGGGAVVTSGATTLTVGTGYSSSIGDTCSFGGFVSAGIGGNASGRTGGSSGGNSGSGGTGAITVDNWDGPSYGGRSLGDDGVYAFGDSSFDGTKYAHGGAGGDTGYGGGERVTYSAPGSGGSGGGEGYNNGLAGNNGCILIKNA